MERLTQSRCHEQAFSPFTPCFCPTFTSKNVQKTLRKCCHESKNNTCYLSNLRDTCFNGHDAKKSMALQSLWQVLTKQQVPVTPISQLYRFWTRLALIVVSKIVLSPLNAVNGSTFNQLKNKLPIPISCHSEAIDHNLVSELLTMTVFTFATFIDEALIVWEIYFSLLLHLLKVRWWYV